MRGLGRTLAHLPAATVFLAGAALLMGGVFQKTSAQTGSGRIAFPLDETAMAIPRVAAPDGSGASLPQPLAPSTAQRLRRLFALQQSGDIPQVLRQTAALEDSTPVATAMLGHLLADRYLGPHTRASAEQLQDWLDRWSDLPDAHAIHRLLVVRMPTGTDAPPPPPGFATVPEREAAPVPEEMSDDGRTLPRNPELDRAVWAATRSRGPAGVARLLRRTPGLSPAYAGQLRGEAAQILFTLNRDEEAFDIAAAGVGSCGDGCPRAALPGYVAGLAAWRSERIDAARAMFALAWRAEVTTASLRAASAYWMARSELRLNSAQAAAPWLQRAAEQRRTFYGILARRTLGLGIGFSRVRPGERETLGEADLAAVADLPAGLRAFALLQIGQSERAAAELRGLWSAAKASRPLARALMLVAEAAGLSDLAVSYADLLATADGRPRENLRFAMPRLRPDNGFSVDPALVYGLARTESNFDTTLVSSAGARGILQIMPETAGFVVGSASYRAETLDDPGVNLDLGQRYMRYLASHQVVGGDLIRLLAAYNCGPASFANWAPLIRDHGDPLLFIEAIPLDETRAHVPRVLTYTWIYAAHLHLSAPSLDELAAGIWPRYHPVNGSPPLGAGLH